MIFFKNTISPHDENKIYFEAVENDTLIGKCTLVIEGNVADIREISHCRDNFIAQGLCKSAYNYAAMRNIYMGKITAENKEGVLKLMRFDIVDGEYINDIPTLLMGNCCDNK